LDNSQILCDGDVRQKIEVKKQSNQNWPSKIGAMITFDIDLEPAITSANPEQFALRDWIVRFA
jgi:hypothetical protein